MANSNATVRGKGTLFTTELKVDDSITFTNDAGATVTGTVRNIISQTELTLVSAVGGSDVTTGGIVTRRRAKLNNPEFLSEGLHFSAIFCSNFTTRTRA